MNSIPTLFEYQAERFSEHLAVKEPDNSITYQELNAKANQIARIILTHVSNTNTPIVTLVSNNFSSIVAMMGILKAGKAYVAIDPSYPEERINDILNDSQSEIIITDDENLITNRLSSNSGDVIQVSHIINLNKIDPTIPTSNLDVKILPEDYANLIYTSGSTGKPKGIINNHRIVLHEL